MGAIVVLGERAEIVGYRLAGAVVVEADDEASVRRAWDDLPAAAALVILTPRAASALDDAAGRGDLLRVVIGRG